MPPASQQLSEGAAVTVVLIADPDANPGETEYLAAQLSSDGITVLRAPGPDIADDDRVRVLVPFVTTRVTDAVMGRLPRLALIATRSTGTDHIDVAAAARRGIAVANVPDYGSVAVAEHTFALLLTLTRIRPHLEPGTDLSGKTMGVIGTGAIGRHVMQIAHGFGMNVLAYDIEHRPGIRYGSLEEVLGQSDVITLHIPATPATRHFINDERIAAMKPGVILLNTARGSLVDTAALSRGLHSGQVAAAGLDVIEPASDAEGGTALPNTIVTPHVAYNTREAIRRISDITLDNIRRWLRDHGGA
jgi:D-lactate dehydrogenase